MVGGCDYNQLYRELYCVRIECCYVVGGCDYNQLYVELYCVWVECCYVVVAVITVSCNVNCTVC